MEISSYFEFKEIPTRGAVKITGVKKKTSRQMWSKIKEGDILEITYIIRLIGHTEATKVEIEIYEENGTQYTLKEKNQSTSKMVSVMLSEFFEYEVLTK